MIFQIGSLDALQFERLMKFLEQQEQFKQDERRARFEAEEKRNTAILTALEQVPAALAEMFGAPRKCCACGTPLAPLVRNCPMCHNAA